MLNDIDNMSKKITEKIDKFLIAEREEEEKYRKLRKIVLEAMKEHNLFSPQQLRQISELDIF